MPRASRSNSASTRGPSSVFGTSRLCTSDSSRFCRTAISALTTSTAISESSAAPKMANSLARKVVCKAGLLDGELSSAHQLGGPRHVADSARILGDERHDAVVRLELGRWHVASGENALLPIAAHSSEAALQHVFGEAAPRRIVRSQIDYLD